MPDHLPDTGRKPLTSLVAAARRLTGKRLQRGRPERWQDEAWDMYDVVGELRFVANQHANALSRARLFAARLPQGDDQPQPLDLDMPSAGDLIAADTVAAIGGGALGRSELLRRIALQQFVPGDGYVVGLPAGLLDVSGPAADRPVGPDLPVTLADLTWHALSVSELSTRGGRIILHVGDEQHEIGADQAIIVRVWRPHPRRWWAADSPVRANLPVLRELVGLTKHVSASVDSRLAGAGLLVLGQSVEVVEASDDEDGGAHEPSTFVDALVETMMVPIRDRDSAAAVVPLVIQVPDDVVDKVQHLTFATPFDDKARELRDEAIRRLALGLDAPPETLLGMGGTNHWSAWQIEESAVKMHVEPALAGICDALTTGYLWPVLEEQNVPDARDYVVWFDTVDLLLRPNRTGEATTLHAAGELSGEALRREAGFSEDDAPVQPDRAVEIALKMVRDQPGPVMDDPALLGVLIDTIRGALDEGVRIEAETDAAPQPDRPAGMPPATLDDPLQAAAIRAPLVNGHA